MDGVGLDMKLSMRLPRHFVSSGEIDQTTDAGKNPIPGNPPTNNQDLTPPKSEYWYLYLYCSSARLRSFCWITAFLHLFAMFAFSGLMVAQIIGEIKIPRLQTQITKNIGIWTNASDMVKINDTAMGKWLDLNQCPLASTTPAKDSAYVVQQVVLDGQGEIDTRALIIAFHAFSFAFQWVASVDDQYYTNLNQGKTNLGHFVEYSITASLMLIAMSAQFGITDVFLLMSIAANCTGCMLFGLLAELLFDQGSEFTIRIINRSKSSDKKDSHENNGGIHIPGHWIAHAAGWFMLTFALVASASNLVDIGACSNSDTIKIPNFVIGVVVVEIVLFTCFGLVQMVSFIYRNGLDESEATQLKRKKEIAETTEFMYILLSLTAKLALGIIVMWGNYTNK